MNKKQLIVVLSLFFLISINYLYAEDKHPIDKYLESCIDQSDSITAAMVKCGESACKQWEAALNRYYSLLMNILDKNDIERLRQSQSAWVKFKDLEFEFIPYSFKVPGSYAGPAEAELKMNIIKSRALQLQAYYEQAKEGQELYKELKHKEGP